MDVMETAIEKILSHLSFPCIAFYINMYMDAVIIAIGENSHL